MERLQISRNDHIRDFCKNIYNYWNDQNTCIIIDLESKYNGKLSLNKILKNYNDDINQFTIIDSIEVGMKVGKYPARPQYIQCFYSTGDPAVPSNEIKNKGTLLTTEQFRIYSSQGLTAERKEITKDSDNPKFEAWSENWIWFKISLNFDKSAKYHFYFSSDNITDVDNPQLWESETREDQYLYLNYTNEVNITFEITDLKGVIDQKTYALGSPYLSLPTPVSNALPAERTFKHWLDEDGNIITNDTIVNFKTAEQKFTGVWKENLITLYTEDSETPIHKLKNENEVFILTDMPTSIPGKEFMGWSINKNSSTIDYPPNILYDLNEDIQLYSVYIDKPTSCYIKTEDDKWEEGIICLKTNSNHWARCYNPYIKTTSNWEKGGTA